MEGITTMPDPFSVHGINIKRLGGEMIGGSKFYSDFIPNSNANKIYDLDYFAERKNTEKTESSFRNRRVFSESVTNSESKDNENPERKCIRDFLVGAAGIEPVTSCMSSMRSNQLS